MTEVKHKDDIFALPESSYDVAKLTDCYAKATEGSQRILPKEKRRYVMYLRKSTDDEAKQVRSLEDQQTECQFLADFGRRKGSTRKRATTSKPCASYRATVRWTCAFVSGNLAQNIGFSGRRFGQRAGSAEPPCWQRCRICYKAKSTIQFDGEFRKSSFWSG